MLRPSARKRAHKVFSIAGHIPGLGILLYYKAILRFKFLHYNVRAFSSE